MGHLGQSDFGFIHRGKNLPNRIQGGHMNQFLDIGVGLSEGNFAIVSFDGFVNSDN